MIKEPKYLYKLIPASRPDLLPSPLPDELPLSELDQNDGFVHLSTATQVPGTIQRFFENEVQMHVLQLEYSKLEKQIKWEDSRGGECILVSKNTTPKQFELPSELGETGAEHIFPHLYREITLGKNDIAEVFELEKQSDGKWDIDLLKKNPKLAY